MSIIENVTVEDAQYLSKDLIQGDESIAQRKDFTEMPSWKIQEAVRLIVNNPNVSERKKKELLLNSWRIHYRVRPPTIEEFLTENWIGPTAESIYPHVRKWLTDFWQPNSPYRHLLLAPSIGTGKALPDSSPVVVDEVPIIEIELEDGTVLVFDEDDDIWVYCPSLTKIKAKDVSNVETKDFPVLPNYYNMKLYNVKKVDEFKNAFEIDSYDELIRFFSSFNKYFYEERGIYKEKHHIIPRSEGGSEDPTNLVNLPFYFHVKAHYLRAKEHEEKGNMRDAFKNYYAVKRCLMTDELPEREVDIFREIQFVSESIEKTKSLQTSQFFIKKEGEPSFKIFEEEWEYYKSQGWEKGRNFNNPSHKRWINKDGKSYYVLQEEFEIYLDAGYLPGMYVTEEFKKANSKRASYPTLGTKWVNKNGERKCVKEDELEDYLKEGWDLGSASETNKGQTWKWDEEKKGRHKYTNGEDFVWAKECPEGFWEAEFHLKGKKQFNNGEIFVFADECPEGFEPGGLKSKKNWYNDGKEQLFVEHCPDGFKKGKLPTGKHYYTNGVESAQLTECPEGWWKGRTIANKKNK